MSLDFTISLPEWAVVENEKLPEFVETLDERMRVVNEFARRNVEENTGGPFAAGVFERDTGRVVIVGINRVEPMQCSSAHAEVVTLSLAQKKLGTWNLGEPGKPALQLVVNWLPCAMCLGAVLWSGVRSLAIAGSDSRLEEITGFDEGPRVDMAKELAKRDVEFIDNGAPFILFFLHASFADDRSRPCLLFSLLRTVLTSEALKVFYLFKNKGRVVYNARGMGDLSAQDKCPECPPPEAKKAKVSA